MSVSPAITGSGASSFSIARSAQAPSSIVTVAPSQSPASSQTTYENVSVPMKPSVRT